jgi:hypothetical protein
MGVGRHEVLLVCGEHAGDVGRAKPEAGQRLHLELGGRLSRGASISGLIRPGPRPGGDDPEGVLPKLAGSGAQRMMRRISCTCSIGLPSRPLGQKGRPQVRPHQGLQSPDLNAFRNSNGDQLLDSANRNSEPVRHGAMGASINVVIGELGSGRVTGPEGELK